MTSDSDDDVRGLLERAAMLAPDRLDRPAVPGQARRRTVRRALGGSLAAVLLVGAAALAVPALDGGGEQRLAQDQPPPGPDGKDVYTVLYDIGTYDEDRASRELAACTSLPGADMPTVAYSIPPQPAVTATGTAEQRRAVEDCLRALSNARIKQGPVVPYDIPVALSVDATGLEPLRVDVTTPHRDPEGEAWLVHDLTLTNPSDQPVYVNDFRFAQMLTGIAAEGRRTADAPGRLFIGLKCGPGQSQPGEPIVPACPEDFTRTEIRPGAAETFEIRVWRDLPGMQPPETGAAYTAAFPVHVRTSEPFGPGDNTGGPEATIRFAYRPGVAGLLGSESKGPGSNRASFLPLPEEEPGLERGFLLARAEGILGGDPTTGCLWLTAPDGSGSTPIVLLHDTAVADFDRTPWVIRDGGTVLATKGDRVVLGGGYGPDDEPGAVAGCPVTGTPFIGQLDPAPAD